MASFVAMLGMLACTPSLAQTPAAGAPASESLSEKSFAEKFLSEKTSLRVRLHVYATVSAEVLDDARDEAGGILKRAGIHVAWLTCAPHGATFHDPSRDPLPRDPGCADPLAATDVVVNLLARILPEGDTIPADALGFARLDEDASAAVQYAYVSLARVQALAGADTLHQSRTLALGITHEIGHLLLGPKAHSPQGVMRAHWRGEELQATDLSELAFTPLQAAQMRAAVAWRRGAGYR